MLNASGVTSMLSAATRVNATGSRYRRPIPDGDGTGHAIEVALVTCVELEIDAYTVVAEVLPLLGTVITLVVVEGEASVVALALDRTTPVRFIAGRRGGRFWAGCCSSKRHQSREERRLLLPGRSW